MMMVVRVAADVLPPCVPPILAYHAPDQACRASGPKRSRKVRDSSRVRVNVTLELGSVVVLLCARTTATPGGRAAAPSSAGTVPGCAA